MPINQDQILQLVQELSQAENLRISVTESAKGACIVGSSAFAGGLLGGPAGLAVGGMFGSILALTYGKGKYRSVVDVILFDMTPAQHARMVSALQGVITNLRIEDFTVLLPLVLSNASTKELILKEVIGFFQSEMNMAITR